MGKSTTASLSHEFPKQPKLEMIDDDYSAWMCHNYRVKIMEEVGGVEEG